jgi:thiol-disulfide isomerase/thioredoxin
MYKLIKIGSESCNPCKILEEDFGEVIEQYPSLLVEKFHTNEQVIQEYSVKKIPLLILLKNDKEVSRLQTGDITKVLDWLSIRLMEESEDF